MAEQIEVLIVGAPAAFLSASTSMKHTGMTLSRR